MFEPWLNGKGFDMISNISNLQSGLMVGGFEMLLNMFYLDYGLEPQCKTLKCILFGLWFGAKMRNSGHENDVDIF